MNLMKVQGFKTLTQAKKELRRYRGWPEAKISELYLPDHPQARKNGNVWVIEVSPERYIGEDFYAM